MRLAAFSGSGNSRVGIVVSDGLVDVARHIPDVPSELLSVIRSWPAWRSRLEGLADRAPDLMMPGVRLLPPIPRPQKIFAIGLNYADHCREAGFDIPTQQVWFSKAASAINGPHEPIELPAVSEQLDYECEMVVVIGRRCRNVPRDRAKEVIFGYCVGNDLSVRDWQLRTPQWSLGKSFDTHAPIGPWITTADAVDPHSLDIRCLINGVVHQQSNTSNLVFDCFAQVEHLSQAMTLEPGDLIFTGTCGGVGAARKPPVWLRAGDKVRVEISELGAIENPVVAGSASVRIAG